MNRFVRTGMRAAAIVAAAALWIPAMESPTGVHAASCASVETLPADVAPSNGFDTPAHIIQTFDNARSKEGCSVALSIDPTAYASASPQQQMLMLFNAERRDRGLGTLSLDSTLLSQIDYNHSKEMAQYGYFNHPSPINNPGWNGVFQRFEQNPLIGGNHWAAENIAAGMNPAQAVYAYMYQDSGEAWGHRENILGYKSGQSTPGGYNWVGIGVANGGPYGVYYTSDFLEDYSYSPPSAADTAAPTLSAPRITSSNTSGTVTVQATNVSDSGAPSGVLGLTSVLFYAGTMSINASSGTANAVAGTPSGSTWTATLSNVPAGAVIHAVAIDGSGNYTDCPSTTTSCGVPSVGGTGGGTSYHPTSSISTHSGTVGTAPIITVSGFAPNETVYVHWGSPSGTTTGAAQVNSAGSGTIKSATPMVPGGSYTLYITGATSGATTTQTFLIQPKIRVIPTSGPPGTATTVQGSGFRVGEQVTVRWNCTSASCTTPVLFTITITASNGTFGRGSVYIPAGATPYTTHTLGAHGSSGDFATTTFYVS